MQNILRRDRFPANTGFGKGHIFGNTAIEVMTHHQHIQMFF